MVVQWLILNDFIRTSIPSTSKVDNALVNSRNNQVGFVDFTLSLFNLGV